MSAGSEPLTAMVDRALDRDDINGAIRLLAQAITEQSSALTSAVWLSRATLVAIFTLIGVIVAVAQ